MNKNLICNGEKCYVFFDVDGTLLPKGETRIPEDTVNAIHQLKENGHIPFICTGRCIGQAKEFVEQIGAESFVTSNGQHINILGEDIYHYDFPMEEKQEIVALLNKYKDISWGYETVEKIVLVDNHVAEKTKAEIEGNGIQQIDIQPFDINMAIKQLWAFGPKETLDNIESQLKEKYKCIRWEESTLELVPKEESKGKAIAKIIENIQDKNIKTYAFGDGYNDIEMLKTVDVGVVMGNAYEGIKEYGDYTTGNVDTGGIVEGLKKLGLI